MASDSAADACVVGLGVIGLPFAAVLAQAGHEVVGVDVDKGRLAMLASAEAPYGDEEVDALIRQHRGRSIHFEPAPVPAKHHLICVGTPLREGTKKADLGALLSAVDAVVEVARPGDVVIVESTVPPGTLAGRVAPRFAAAGKEGVLLAHAPERLLPGDVMRELLNNDRLVGGLDHEATRRASDLYRSFSKAAVIETDATTAELTKILENTFRDVNVALANELAVFSRRLGVDPAEAFALANRHPRVDILSPGIGVGGHCLPVDPWFLHEIDPEGTDLLATARRLNEAIPRRVARLVQEWFAGTGCKRLLLVGKSYKPDVWDPRESPAIEIFERLMQAGVPVAAWDPLEDVDAPMPSVDTHDAVVLLVPHMAVTHWLTQINPGALADASTGAVQDA